MSRSFVAALLVFVATRVWLLGWFEPKLNGDVLIYFRYAVDGVDLGHQAYRETDLEYPPLAWWTIATPRVWPSQPIYRSYLLIGDGSLSDFHAEYFQRFRALMALFDSGAFALFLAIVARRRRELLATAAWGYVLGTTLLPHVLYDRLDIGLLFFVLLWAWCRLRSTTNPGTTAMWQIASYAALGLGISYKLIPLAIVPACVMADVRSARANRAWGSLFASGVALVLTALGPFIYYHLASGPGVWKLFTYHGTRGLEIESLWASLVLPLKWLGVELAVSHGHGSINLDSPLSALLAQVSTVALVAILFGSATVAWRDSANESQFDTARLVGYRVGLIALLAAVVVAKVLSVQYLLWTLPLLVLLGCETLSPRGLRRLIGVVAVCAALSTLLYPYLFFLEIPWGTGTITNPWPLAPSLHPFPCAVLIVRNILLVAGVVGVARGLRRYLK